MSDSLAPSDKRRMPMRFSLIAAILPALVICNAAMAQVSGMATPTPTMGATSPLGLGTGSTVSPTGIPLGATEIASPGISPAPTGVTGTIAMPSSSTTCSTLGTSPSGMFGSTASFDGGGMAPLDPRRRPPRRRRERQCRRECQRHRECRQLRDYWKRRDCRECAAPVQAALLHRRPQRQRCPQRRAAPREPEFRWDLSRLAISGLVPQQRYRRSAYCPLWGQYRWCQRCPLLHLRPLFHLRRQALLGALFPGVIQADQHWLRRGRAYD